MADKPLTRQELSFVNWFRKYRDIYKAAERAHIPKNQAKRTYDRIEIQEEIERQDGVVERERARVQVEAEGITRSFLDVELLQVIKLDAKNHTAGKLRGIELGYVRAGVLQVGNTKSLDLTPPNPDDEVAPPIVYQAIFSGNVTVKAAPIMPDSAQSHPPASPPVKPQSPAVTSEAPSPKVGRLKVG